MTESEVPFACSYTFDGKVYSLTIWATTSEEAEMMLKAVGENGKVDGRLTDIISATGAKVDIFSLCNGTLGKPVCQKLQRTIRKVEGNCPFTDGAFDAVCDVADFAFSHLEFEKAGHLFITVIGTVALRCGPNENDFGFGLYHSGMCHIAVCGSMPEEETDKEHWLRELRKTVIHEIIHYKQDLDGTLGASEENEQEAEELSEMILVAFEVNEVSRLALGDCLSD